ncbi:PIN domain-containing protein [Candidatus Woesearchaeota archaeon]|nr:PIN domain-containing protein [Candidatus Woesearchaeota archaeon]
MADKYLLDTCIWRDFYENRFSRSGNPLGEYASKLFIKIIKDHDTILYSEALIRELKIDYDEKDIFDMLNVLLFSKVLERIDITKEQFNEAKKLAEDRDIPFVDCLCAVQARDHNAIAVTQDKHFFENLSDITKAVKPQDIS